MSRWKTNFENQQAVSRIQDSLQLLESFNIEGLASNHLPEFGRLLKVLRFLNECLSSFDPELCSLNSFASWGAWTNNLQQNVRAYVQGRNRHLQQANQFVDELLNTFRQFDAAFEPENRRAIIEASNALHKKIVQDLQSRAGQVKTEFDALSKEVANTKNHSQENDGVIQKQKARLDESIAEFQKQFSAAQETRGKDFTAELRKNNTAVTQHMQQLETQFKQASENRTKEYEALIKSLREQSDGHLAFIKKREDDVNKIWGAVGTSAFAGNFKITLCGWKSSGSLATDCRYFDGGNRCVRSRRIYLQHR